MGPCGRGASHGRGWGGSSEQGKVFLSQLVTAPGLRQGLGARTCALVLVWGSDTSSCCGAGERVGTVQAAGAWTVLQGEG